MAFSTSLDHPLTTINQHHMRHFLPIFILLLAFYGCRQPKATATVYPPGPDPALNCSPLTTDRAWYTTDSKAPLFEGMGDLHFPATTDQAIVQQYVNQGLTLAYGFNHAEAARSFYYATRLDPDCAMAHWGYAYVLGPNYNAGMESDNYPRAFAAIQRAKAIVSEAGTAREKALIEALSLRYVKEAVEDRSPLDQAYAEAMQAVFEAFPDDPDIGALYAEAQMDLHPWDLWDKEGNARPWTPDILNTLETVISKVPNHPGANHFYIHAVEASNQPEKGLSSARVFDEDVVPNAGHLVHMASHIYIRTGDYHKGSLANLRAVRVDSNYITACRAQGAYPLVYHPHNHHFLAATATLGGNSSWAIEASHKIAEHADNDLMESPGWGIMQLFYTIPLNVYVKFAKWGDILATPRPSRKKAYTDIVWHYARGMALIGTNELSGAEKELGLLRDRREQAPLEEINLGVNSIARLAEIAELVLEGELEAARGHYPEAIERLEQAVAVEDGLNYIEPPEWFFSVRHHLGAALVDAARYQEAIAVYEADLANFPKNGWALHGLALAHQRLGESEEAVAINAQIDEAWMGADVELNGSRVK